MYIEGSTRSPTISIPPPAITTTMVLKIHGHAIAPLVRLVAEVCREKEVPYELVNVEVYKGEHKTPAFKEFQPFGQVPYIVSDSFGQLTGTDVDTTARMTTASFSMNPEPFADTLQRSTHHRVPQTSCPMSRKRRPFLNKRYQSKRRTFTRLHWVLPRRKSLRSRRPNVPRNSWLKRFQQESWP